MTSSVSFAHYAFHFRCPACEIYIGNRPCGAGQTFLDLEANGIEIVQGRSYVDYVPEPLRSGLFDSAAYYAHHVAIEQSLGGTRFAQDYTPTTAFRHYLDYGYNAGWAAVLDTGAVGVFDNQAYFDSQVALEPTFDDPPDGFTVADVFRYYKAGGYQLRDIIYVF